MFLTEPNDKLYAYVHYCTLFDSFARGFVRPVCASYVTNDPNKVMAHFEDIRAEFAKVRATCAPRLGTRPPTLARRASFT